jgi:hypothetical protein
MNENFPNRNSKVNKLQGQYLASNLNEFWTIDITIISNKFFFFFIIDLASQKVIHHSVSECHFNKLEAVKILDKALIIENTLSPHKKLEVVHTNSAAIFLSHHWMDFFSPHHITSSSADSKMFLNEVSERFNRTLKDMLRET